MTSHEEPFDDRLAAMFSAGVMAPTEFTTQVLRRIQEDRWRRETRLDRVFHGALAVIGVVLLGAAFVTLQALGMSIDLPRVSLDIPLQVMTVALVVLVLWRGRKLASGTPRSARGRA